MVDIQRQSHLFHKKDQPLLFLTSFHALMILDIGSKDITLTWKLMIHLRRSCGLLIIIQVIISDQMKKAITTVSIFYLFSVVVDFQTTY